MKPDPFFHGWKLDENGNKVPLDGPAYNPYQFNWCNLIELSVNGETVYSKEMDDEVKRLCRENPPDPTINNPL